MAQAAIPRLDMPLRGIGLVIGGVTVFSLQDVIIKLLSGQYPVLEIVFARSLVSLPILFALATFPRKREVLRFRQPLQQSLRGSTTQPDRAGVHCTIPEEDCKP